MEIKFVKTAIENTLGEVSTLKYDTFGKIIPLISNVIEDKIMILLMFRMK